MPLAAEGRNSKAEVARAVAVARARAVAVARARVVEAARVAGRWAYPTRSSIQVPRWRVSTPTFSRSTPANWESTHAASSLLTRMGQQAGRFLRYNTS